MGEITAANVRVNRNGMFISGISSLYDADLSSGALPGTTPDTSASQGLQSPRRLRDLDAVNAAEPVSFSASPISWT